jgi:3-dehydroquinate dehydratase-1
MPSFPAPLRAGRTAVIVPLVSADTAGLRSECEQIAALGPGIVDLVEWRVDRFEPAAHEGEIDAALAVIADLLPGMPILATYRTPAEEGRPELRPHPPAASPDLPDNYLTLVARLARAQGVALVDVERSHPHAAAALDACRRAGTPVVLSEHHFDRALPADKVRAVFAAMAQAGASVAKLAVMPDAASDVTELMYATSLAAEESEVPLIAIAMGGLGQVTRVAAPAFGSCATYCTVSGASAPGQVPAREAREAVDRLTAART